MKMRQKSANRQSKNNNIVLDIARKLQEEQNSKDQASKILNAYRRVQDIKIVPKSSNPSNNKTIATTVQRPTSQYSNKVKQTLRQLNASKNRYNKQKNQNTQNLNKYSLSVDNTKNNNMQGGAAQRHLKSRAIQKIFGLLQNKYEKIELAVFAQFVLVAQEDQQGSYQLQYRIKAWKLRRIFRAWYDQIVLTKIQKTRKQKQAKQKQRKQLKFACDFHYFMLVKKSMKGWKHQTKKQIRNREIKLLEAQQQKIERQNLIKQILNEDATNQPQKIPPTQLQNKLQGFLKNLQNQVDNKGRLNTIKQKTEESDIHIIPGNQPERQHQQQCIEQQEQQNQILQERQQQQRVNDNEEIKGPLTNQQLEKRRKQLAEKAKNRKAMLDKLRKQKQGKKKQQQEDKIALQKQIEEQQKRHKQQQYRKFMKNKRQQEQWEIKEQELLKRAQQFNKIRIIRYFGWQPWRSIKHINEENAIEMKQILMKIILKRNYDKLTQRIGEISQQVLNKQLNRADILYKKNLKKKSIKALKLFTSEQLQIKQQLSTRHEINILKIHLAEWKRTRTNLQLENLEWERPRIKKAQYLHALSLLNKGFVGLNQNKVAQIQQKRIQQHKRIIKKKVKDIVHEQPTINYEEFL